MPRRVFFYLLAVAVLLGCALAVGVNAATAHPAARVPPQRLAKAVKPASTCRTTPLTTADQFNTMLAHVQVRHPEVRNLHDLRTRAAGVHTFIQFHIELDPAISITRAHEISDRVERSVCEAFPNSEVIIHQDPAGLERPAGLSRS